jgi:voltage-gated potassium channel
MNTRRRFITAISGFIIIVTTGTIGYMAIEGWSFIDSLYMTIITVSTVGFEEVHALGTAGRAFNIFLIIGGTSVMLYTLTSVAQYILEGHLVNTWGRRRMKDKISRLSNHVILCGYGLVGREVARVFESEGTSFVVIELDPHVISLVAESNYLVIEGNATSDDILVEAGIHRARSLVAALGTDADNVYVTLSAREMRPDLFIVARHSAAESESKLINAGADRTMSPYRIGGRRLAMLTLRPVVVDFIDTAMRSRSGDLILENMKLSSDSPVAGMTIQDSQQYSRGASILAVKKKDGILLANPSQETVVEIEDELVVIGTREQLRGLEGLA